MEMAVLSGIACPVDVRRKNSADATSADAPPPNPFSSATICGICVIFTVLAAMAPTSDPTIIAMMMPVNDKIWPKISVATIDVRQLFGISTSTLPEVDIRILDVEEVCDGDLNLSFEAPHPVTSSEPFDINPEVVDPNDPYR